MNLKIKRRTKCEIFSKVNKSAKQFLKLFLKITISILCIVFVFKNIDVEQVLITLTSLNYFYLILAAIFFILSKFISSIRLNHFFKDSGVIISEIDNLKLYLLGMYYNLFLPGGIGGDGYKIYYLNNLKNYSKKELLIAILADRISGLVALGILLVVIGLFIIPAYWIKILLVSFTLISITAYYLITVYKFKSFKKSFLLTNTQGLLVQLAQVACVYFLLVSVQVDGNYLSYLFIFLISSVVAILPFTIGGLGAREITFMYGSQFLFLDIASAITISLLFYLITAIVSFGGIYYSFKGVRLSK